MRVRPPPQQQQSAIHAILESWHVCSLPNRTMDFAFDPWPLIGLAPRWRNPSPPLLAAMGEPVATTSRHEPVTRNDLGPILPKAMPRRAKMRIEAERLVSQAVHAVEEHAAEVPSAAEVPRLDASQAVQPSVLESHFFEVEAEASPSPAAAPARGRSRTPSLVGRGHPLLMPLDIVQPVRTAEAPWPKRPPLCDFVSPKFSMILAVRQYMAFLLRGGSTRLRLLYARQVHGRTLTLRRSLLICVDVLMFSSCSGCWPGRDRNTGQVLWLCLLLDSSQGYVTYGLG